MIEKLLSLPAAAIIFVIGAFAVLAPCLSVDVSKRSFDTHAPTTFVPVVLGVALLAIAIALFIYNERKERGEAAGAGLDLSHVKEKDGVIWTTVNGFEIRVVTGRITDPVDQGTVIVLPCNEYFDDECAADPQSALGAYVAGAFQGQANTFLDLARTACTEQFGQGTEQRKKTQVRAESFGTGKCLLLENPLGRDISVALVSTTTQRADEGLRARISYLFDGMHELAKSLSNVRSTEVTMPIMGAGHGGIYAPLALVALLAAIAEVARHTQVAHRLRKVTIVVFKKDANSAAQVEPIVVRRALGLIGA